MDCSAKVLIHLKKLHWVAIANDLMAIFLKLKKLYKKVNLKKNIYKGKGHTTELA
jgi:hypothetical protein